MSKKVQSVEPQVADKINQELKSYGIDYKLEQETLNSEIDKALAEYASKSGGKGGNRPDVKFLIQDEYQNYYPVLIEYKGYKDKLEKLDDEDFVDNTKKNNDPNYQNIKNYAVNGAVHYANALLHYTSYTDIIAIGITGYKNEEEELEIKVAPYIVSKENLGIGQKEGEYKDVSFLKQENLNNFIKKIKNTKLTEEELDQIKEQREKEIDKHLKKLNNDIYKDEKGISETDRVYLVAASIIANLGVAGKVTPLEVEDLKSTLEPGNTDGDIILRKVKAFLTSKNLPKSKEDLIVNTLKNTLLSENINKPINGETQLKRIFSKIVNDLGIYYKIGLNTDFTGKLFNEMYSWLGFTQDKLNDVVLTPSYIATLLVKLAKVNKDSYVWDFATGSAGLLVAAMNEMIKDAKEKLPDETEFRLKESHIKAEQLLGLELLPNVYMLAILNMILMGDGSSNILNKDSLRDFDGNYGFKDNKEKFPADAFILNPPYSADGNGMVFVKKALSMMDKGYAAIITQSSAGTGKAKDINKEILEKNTLIASIKMPDDLFVGKASVQTHIYVFKVGEAHNPHQIVKFINFENDGYARSSRKKGSNNLIDEDNAKEKYQELVDIIHLGPHMRKRIPEDCYYENTIDPLKGDDWNQTKPIDITPTFEDFEKTIGEYLEWELSQVLQEKIDINDVLDNTKATS